MARTTISKDALLFFDAAARRPHLPRSDVTNSGAGIELHTLNLLAAGFRIEL
jgi:hypothetical protein